MTNRERTFKIIAFVSILVLVGMILIGLVRDNLVN